MINMKKIILINVLLLIVLIGGGITGYYFYNQSVTYLKTENAKIDGQQVVITPPASGKIIDWVVEPGKTVNAGDKLGTIQVPPQPQLGQNDPVNVDIVAPVACTIVQQNVVKNNFVAAGTPLAYAFDLDHLWATANIKETDISDIKTGQDVDVYVDANTGSPLKGKISLIGLTTANTFSLLPSSNTTGNYTKVTQVIPVKISLEGYKGLFLVPGMNVTVRIHK